MEILPRIPFGILLLIFLGILPGIAPGNIEISSGIFPEFSSGILDFSNYFSGIFLGIPAGISQRLIFGKFVNVVVMTRVLTISPEESGTLTA